MSDDELSGATILSLLQTMRTEFTALVTGLQRDIRTDLQQMVSRDVFEAEQRHHAERHRQLDEQIRQLSVELDEMRAAEEAVQSARKTDRRSFWIWLASASGGLAALITAFETWFHAH